MADKEKDALSLVFLNGAKIIADKYGWIIRDLDLDDLWIDFDCKGDKEAYIGLGGEVSDLAESIYQEQIRKLFKV